MLTRICVIVFSACLGISAAVAAQNSSPDYNPGQAWLRMERSSRVVWVWGAAEGQKLVVEELQLKSTKDLENLVPLESADVISDIMTQYYGDAANAYIPWKYMAVVAKMKLGGKTDAILNQRLQNLREYATFERSRPKSDK